MWNVIFNKLNIDNSGKNIWFMKLINFLFNVKYSTFTRYNHTAIKMYKHFINRVCTYIIPFYILFLYILIKILVHYEPLEMVRPVEEPERLKSRPLPSAAASGWPPITRGRELRLPLILLSLQRSWNAVEPSKKLKRWWVLRRKERRKDLTTKREMLSLYTTLVFNFSPYDLPAHCI